MSDNIIKQIKVKNNGAISEQNYQIGTSAEYVDYQGTSLQNILGSGLSSTTPIKQQLNEMQSAIQENKNTIQQMNESYNTAKKIINRVNSLSDKIDEIQNNTSREITAQLNQKIFTTNDIRYQINSSQNLQNVLGNLINLPLNSQNLRICLENIVKRLGTEGAGENNLEWEPFEGGKPFKFECYRTEDGEIDSLKVENFIKEYYSEWYMENWEGLTEQDKKDYIQSYYYGDLQYSPLVFNPEPSLRLNIINSLINRIYEEQYYTA